MLPPTHQAGLPITGTSIQMPKKGMAQCLGLTGPKIQEVFPGHARVSADSKMRMCAATRGYNFIHTTRKAQKHLKWVLQQKFYAHLPWGVSCPKGKCAYLGCSKGGNSEASRSPHIKVELPKAAP